MLPRQMWTDDGCKRSIQIVHRDHFTMISNDSYVHLTVYSHRIDPYQGKDEMWYAWVHKFIIVTLIYSIVYVGGRSWECWLGTNFQSFHMAPPSKWSLMAIESSWAGLSIVSQGLDCRWLNILGMLVLYPRPSYRPDTLGLRICIHLCWHHHRDDLWWP